MAPNKKKGFNNKKKKNRGGGRVPTTRHDPRQDAAPASLLRTFKNTLPTFHHTNQKVDAPDDATAGGGYYQIYKRSTTKFWEWMQEALPNAKMKTVNDLHRGADLVLEQNIGLLGGGGDSSQHQKPMIVPPVDILQALTVSIQYRQMHTGKKFGGRTDAGHQYMVDVLKYCRSVLKFGRTVAYVAMADSSSKETEDVTRYDDDFAIIGGRFNALTVDDEDEEEDLEIVEQKIREHNFPTFEPPTAPENKEIDIEQDLINGDDRFQAMALLYTMDDLMGAVENHYGFLKNLMHGQEGGTTYSSILQVVMECAVAANMATESVHMAENTLAVDHPHLSSFYHVLALAFLPNYVADVEKLMDRKKLEEDPHVALKFVAEIVECSFHNKGDTRIPAKLKKFVKKTGIELSVLDKQARMIHLMASLETQLAQEEAANAHMNAKMELAGLRPHTWLQQSTYIGGDRCIINTQNIVQKLMDIVQEKTKLVGKPGFWGPQFDENTKPALRIRGDLDEPFASSILPELIEICRQAPFPLLPERSQLLTVLDLLQQHVKGDRTSPVPVALTFGLHAMLTSIFILQGDGDLARIASHTKQSYNALFAQLDELSDDSRSPQNAPNFYWNVGIFKNVVNFAKPAPLYDHPLGVDSNITEKLAFWNPLIGGDYLLYGAYICSIGLGSATVDSLGQLRFTLHLFNALVQRHPSLMEVPFLKNMDKVFTQTKAVWVGGRPKKGSYCKHFWMAWGMNAAFAAQMALEDMGNEQATPSYLRNRRQQDSDQLRKLDEIFPQEYSASYRRLVMQDFDDDEGVAHYTIRNATKEARKQHEGLLDLLTRVNMTRDAMDEDENVVLPVNFPAVGVIMLEFTNALSDHMGWDSILNQAFASYPEEMRAGKTMGGKRMKPGGFNASDLNLKRQGLAHLLGDLLSRIDKGSSDDAIKKAADFMARFFKDVSTERYTFFVDKAEPRPARRNPREGSYPYGRTGRTPHDPLQGILYFKSSKAGTPVVRFVKPGKLTPFRPTPDGDVASPYEFTGSKMVREASGKYRHIASYSLEELIDLGWDGATYTSTRGRHAASGHHVPFIVGYDSDSEDEYEPIDIAAGKRAEVIGLPPEENGLYVRLPDMQNPGQFRVMKIKNVR